MKILKFQAENIKRLVAVEITPEGNLITITGANGAGKSSVLDAIFWALSGTKNIQDKPIRDGQDKAVIKLDLGEYTVERRFTEKGTYLDVKAANGFKASGAQEFLSSLLGAITFDPLEFARMKPADQYEAVRGIVDLGVDLDKLKQSYDRDFEERKFYNREIKNLDSAIGMIVLPEDIPDQPVDGAAKMQELMLMRDKVEKLRQSEKRTDTCEKDIRDTQLELDRARQIVENWELSLQGAKDALEEQKKAHELLLAAQPKPEDIEKLQEEIKTANEKNEIFRKAQEKKSLEEKLKKASDQADELTEKLEGYKKQKDDAFAAAKWPVPGMSIQDGQVYYNGLPFDQASSAEQLRISAAIAMSGNPKLRVMRIKDGSLLDPNGFELLKKMADENDFQIWVETCYTDDPLAIIIEDGTVKGAEPKTAAAE